MFKPKTALIFGVLIIVSVLLIGCAKKDQNDQPKDKALDSFKSVLKEYPDKIGFHKTLKHWNFSMPSDEKFEWTKNVGENKADYAMVLLAEPFIKAGFDAEKLKDDNWLFKAAEVEDGKQLPDRLIHPFNIADKNENSNGWEDALRRVFNKMPSVVSFNDDLKTTTLALGDGFVVELKENSTPKNSEFLFKINTKALIDAGLDLSKLENSEWKAEGNNQLVKLFKLEYK